MFTYRNGQQRLMCDGCFKDMPVTDHTRTAWKAPDGREGHACSATCGEHFDKMPPIELRCPSCDLLVASGALACMNGHAQPTVRDSAAVIRR